MSRTFKQFQGYKVNLLGFDIIIPDNCGWVTIDEDGTVSWWFDKPEFHEADEGSFWPTGFWASPEDDTYALHLGKVEGLEDGEWKKGCLNLHKIDFE